MITLQPGTYKNMTGTGSITSAAARLIGFYVNSTTAGTLVFRDGGASGTVVSGTITPAIGWHFYPICGVSASGLHVTVANTIDVTFITVAG